MFATATGNHQSSPSLRPSQLFSGIRFVLLGFDPIKKAQVSRKLLNGGAVDAGQYGPSCTHVIVDKLVYDDPMCVAARRDGKILVSSLWVDHSFDVGAPVDTTSVMYTPVKDLNGISGAKSLVICLTGYQREDREDIMTMVELIGAQVSKPLIGNKVTHLICYKFEGEKYVLARKMKRIKLVNHRWLEDCLKAWEILPEADYSKSGYELEMEAEAKDSEDERECFTTRHNDGKTANSHHSLLSKQEISKTISDTSAPELFSTAQETVSVPMKTTSDYFSNSHEVKFKHQDTENLISVTSKPSTHYGKSACNTTSTPSNRSSQIEAEMVKSASYFMKDPIRTTPSEIEMKSNTSSDKRLNKLNFSDAYDMPFSLVQKGTPYSSPAISLEDEQVGTLSNRKTGTLKPLHTSQYKDAESAYQGLKKDPQIDTSPAQKTPCNISGRKSLSSKGKNVTCDVTSSKTSTLEIEDLNAVPKPQEEYKETMLSINSNRDVGMAESAMHSPSAVTSDLQKSSTLNSEVIEQSAGSNPKPVRRKSISKKFSAPKLSKKITVNQKGSILLKNSEPEIDDKNLLKYQQSEKVSSVAKSGTKIETGVISGIQIENTSENKSLYMDDETEPPDDEDQASKEKHEDAEPENVVDVLVEERAAGTADVVDPSTNKHYDENDLLSINHKVSLYKSDENTEDTASEIPLTKNGKKNTAVSEDATPNQAKKARRNVNDLDNSMEVKRAGVCNDHECNNDEKDDVVDADREIESGVNKKETKRNTGPLSKTKKDVGKRNVTDLETSLNVERPECVYSDTEHQNEEKNNDGANKGVDVDTEIVLNKKETKRNKRPLSGTKNDDAKAVNNKGKPASNQAAKTCDLEEAQKENVQIHVDDGADKDGDMDTENVLNKKETKRGKRLLSITKEDDAKAVNKKGNPTSNQAGKTCDMEAARKVNVQIHVDDGADKDGDMDTENVLNKKETKQNKRPPSRTKKDDAKAVKKKGKPSSAQAVKMCAFEEAQKENVQILVDDGADMDTENVQFRVDDGAGMDTENVLNKKENKRDKRPLSRTKKDDAKAVNSGDPTSNQPAKRRHLEEQQENIRVHVDDRRASNKRVFKVAKEFPEKNIDKANPDVFKDEPRWFILTGHKLQRREFQQIIRRLKGRVCRVNHSWSYQATHFIVPDPIKRTEKFFAAAASGRWILKTDYLSASNQAGKYLAEETYEWHNNGLSEDGQINLEAPRKWRLLKEKTGHGAFYGMKIVVYGECILPTLDTLKRAVKAGDGTILATSPPYTRFLNTGIDFAVVSPGMPHVDVWVQEFLKHEIPCISADYLVEYVCKPGYPLEKHVQYGTNVWAERSYNNLKNRLEEKISAPRTPNSNDVACQVCGSRDRGEEMLICGDESGVIGCGVGTHIDCCDPPFEDVPEEDWFCSKCSKKPNNSKSKTGSKKKGSASRGK
ncbi:hypothetical protein QVD17_22073 [Tagetes erecta]|uniref:BRCT domain-containing protein n=1 Tax=Tagetes erecta TaxID=13708 RepID=A0AAD8KF62_TARER|nr:hypothetical protein QVD17_22073 [Tagetes erecta]